MPSPLSLRQKQKSLQQNDYYHKKQHPTLSSISYFNLPYTWIHWAQLVAIYTAMFGSLIWALLFSYEKVTLTHCRNAKQFFPSFSSVIGNAYPELFIWRVGLIILLPLRFFEGLILHWFYTRKQIFYQHGNTSPSSQHQNQGYNVLSNSDPDSSSSTTSSSSIETRITINNNTTNNITTNNNNKMTLQTKQRAQRHQLQEQQRNHNLQLLSKSTKSFLPHHLGSSNMKQSTIYISYQNVSWYRYILSLCHTIALIIEYCGLTLLTYVSSSEDFLRHEIGFVMFLLASQIHLFINFYLTRSHWKMHGLTFKLQLLKLILWLINITCIYGCYYFYVRHNASCEDYIYSYFGLSEYTLVFTNIMLHTIKTLEHGWQGQFSFSCTFPSFPYNTHPNNEEIFLNHDDDDENWITNGQLNVPTFTPMGLTNYNINSPTNDLDDDDDDDHEYHDDDDIENQPFTKTNTKLNSPTSLLSSQQLPSSIQLSSMYIDNSDNNNNNNNSIAISETPSQQYHLPNNNNGDDDDDEIITFEGHNDDELSNSLSRV